MKDIPSCSIPRMKGGYILYLFQRERSLLWQTRRVSVYELTKRRDGSYPPFALPGNKISGRRRNEFRIVSEAKVSTASDSIESELVEELVSLFFY